MSENRIVSSFEELKISRRLHAALAMNHIVTPTPIQSAAIPLALDGLDVVGIAQTGTGKTLAFALPMIQRLKKGKAGLVLAPTRELALQIEKTFLKLGSTTALLIGGAPMDKQVNRLRKQPDFLIATPGRLIDHLQQRTVDLRNVVCVTLDEADRMLDMGFAPSIKRILQQAPSERQTLMFSATMPDEIVELVESFMIEPQRVEVARAGTTAELVDQHLVVVPWEQKGDVLHELILDHPGPALVFTRTRHGARKVAMKLREMGHAACEIHSDRSLSQRFDAMEGFRQGRYRVLVATDIAARGIDVKDVSVVVNFDLPNDPEDYVHRVGRTGRAGATGVAYTICTPDQRGLLRGVETLIQQELPSHSRSTVEINRGKKSKGRNRHTDAEERPLVAAAVAAPSADDLAAVEAAVQEDRKPLPPVILEPDHSPGHSMPFHRRRSDDQPATEDNRAERRYRAGDGESFGNRGRNPWQRRDQNDGPRFEGRGERKPWENRGERPGGFQGRPERKPWENRDDRPRFEGRGERPGGFQGRPERKPWENRDDRPRFEGRGERKPWENRGDRPGGFQGRPDRKPWENRGERPEGFQGRPERKPWENRDDRPRFEGRGERKPWENRGDRPGGFQGRPDRKPWENRGDRPGGFQGRPDRKPWENRDDRPRFEGRGERKPWENRGDRPGGFQGRPDRKPWENRGDRPGGFQGRPDRKPWENRGEGANRSEGGRPERKPWENRGGGGFAKGGSRPNPGGGFKKSFKKGRR